MNIVCQISDYTKGILYIILIPILIVGTSFSAYTAEELSISATGTNQTTGHIATLLVENNTQEVFTFETRGFFIPSDGYYQSYVVPYPLKFTVAPTESVEIPIFGYCADVNTPPAPMGHPLADFSDWIFHSEKWFTGLQLDLTAFYHHHGVNPRDASLFNSNPAVFNELYFFSLNKELKVVDNNSDGHKVSNHIPLNASNHLNEFALVIHSKEPLSFGLLTLDAAFSLSTTVAELQAQNQLTTPYSDSPKREKEALMQHSIWIYTAALEGKVYSLEDFELKLKEELQRQTGMSFEHLPEEIQSGLREGAVQFWEAFQLLGRKSRVFKAY